MYENFNIFNLTANRCVGVVNPFFRHYSNKSVIIMGSDEEIYADMPDIWPTYIEKDAFRIPENKRIVGHIALLDRDEYIYTPYCLSFIETVYVNTLALKGHPRFIGFKDVKRIIDSIYCMAAWNAGNREDVVKDDVFDEYAFNKHFGENIYVKMMNREYGDSRITAYINPLLFWDVCKVKAWGDIEGNKHLLEYLLSQEEMVRTHDCFNFMGTPNERIYYLKNCLKELSNQRE